MYTQTSRLAEASELSRVTTTLQTVMSAELINSYIYRFDGVPHSAFDFATDCALPMLLEFLGDPSKAPADSCVADYSHTYQTTGTN